MKKLSDNNIIYIDKPIDYHFDPDSETSKLLRKNFANETTVLDYIKNGNMEQLNSFMTNNTFNIFLGYSKTDLGNERAFAQRCLSLASYAAIQGGLDCLVTYSLIYKYQNIIELSSDNTDILALSAEILRNFCGAVHWSESNKDYCAVTISILKYIQSNINKKITLSGVAEALNLHPNYLSKVFKQDTGENFSDYVIKKKIVLAKHLMRTTDKTLTQIAYYLDFSSQSYFSNCFKKHENCTPKQYIQSNKA